ncbi:MAG: hypothetical protein RLZZ139_3162 [Cyanobacteriota bacterium]|jgi:hypothetical protein
MRAISFLLWRVKSFKNCLDPPQPPLKRGANLNSSPFLRGIEGDLLELLIAESNS